MFVSERAAALDVCYPAQPSQIPLIRMAVADVARRFGAGRDALLQINLAVTEAVTNAVVHAYRDSDAACAGAVRIVVQPDGRGCLDVRVRDDGVGLTPRVDSPGLGLGLGLMVHESDGFEARTPPGGGTEIVLRFRL